MSGIPLVYLSVISNHYFAKLLGRVFQDISFLLLHLITNGLKWDYLIHKQPLSMFYVIRYTFPQYSSITHYASTPEERLITYTVTITKCALLFLGPQSTEKVIGQAERSNLLSTKTELSHVLSNNCTH